jgi:glutamate-1-semialdehyde 2,1-aminomutase
VISGFRVGFEGAAAYYGIQPDILTYGKIIGGGLPVGAYGASAEVMDHISPVGSVYQAGTLSGNPVAMAAGIAQLSELLQPGFYEELHAKTAAFVKDIQNFVAEKGYEFKVFTIGSIFWFAFTGQESISTADDIDPASMLKFKTMHRELINRGIYLGPSGYEVGFISSAHTIADLETTKTAIFDSLDIVFNQ